jgi:hypothetical protein
MADVAASKSATNSRTIADTIVGEHEHTICGYSLLKGIGDGEPIASDRFLVGGHEWVLLFYPDGKRSSNSDHGQVYARAAPNIQLLAGREGDANAQNINPVQLRGEAHQQGTVLLTQFKGLSVSVHA